MSDNDWDCEKCIERKECRWFKELVEGNEDDNQFYCRKYNLDPNAKPTPRTTNRIKVYLAIPDYEF